MKTTELAISKIKEFEGLKLKSYQDSVGRWTIGHGHAKGVTENEICTPEQAEEFLRSDLIPCELSIDRMIHIPITQGQFDAFVSFSFNLGIESLAKSTLLSLFQRGFTIKASEEFAKWDHAGKEILPGLVARRKWESERFLGLK